MMPIGAYVNIYKNLNLFILALVMLFSVITVLLIALTNHMCYIYYVGRVNIARKVPWDGMSPVDESYH
jgi:hypothetical protein